MPAPTYLIADLHLESERPETTRLLLDFLSGPMREAGALYILGDLFEAWIGDDAPGDLGRDVASGLRDLSDRGVDVHFICGNRDFLLGSDYCQRAGMTYQTEPARLQYPEGDILLLHGDVLCTDDVAYQRFRRKVRKPGWQRRMLATPVWWRKFLARLARVMSRRHTGTTEAGIMDVNPDAVADCFRTHDVRRMIHGHTHRRAIHDIEIDSLHHQRMVLGDWHDEGSTVCVDDSGIAMYTIARNDDDNVELRLQETAAPLVGTTSG